MTNRIDKTNGTPDGPERRKKQGDAVNPNNPYIQKTHPLLLEMARSNPGRGNFFTALDEHLTIQNRSIRPYQMEASAAFPLTDPAQILTHSSVIKGGRQAKSALLVSPTGSGKTSIFVPEILDHVRQGKKVLVLGHRDYLLAQIKERIESSCPASFQKLVENQIQVCQGKKSLENASAKVAITIASTQTLSANRDDLPNFFKQFDTIVIDEAHHYTAPDYLATLETVISSIPARKEIFIIGATATPLRHTPGVIPMSDLFPLDNVIWTRTMRQLIREGFLKYPEGIRINTNLGADLSVDPETQNINSEDVKLLTRTAEFNQNLFDAYEEHASGKNAIFYSHDLEHSELLFQEALKRKLPVVMIDGEKVTYMKTGKKSERIEETGSVARGKALSEFGTKYKVIINCQVLTEALDLPQTQALVYGSVTRSVPELQQIVGRGMRIDPAHPKQRSFKFIYLDPQTRNKINFANLAMLGLEEFEKIETNTDGEDVGPRTMEPMAEEPLTTNGIVNEGSLVDHPDPEWEKILKVALKKKFPELNTEEAIMRVCERMALSSTSTINYRDIAVGNDILFGTHGSSKIREAQRIFRQMVIYLDLNMQAIQTRFPRLTGFSDYNELKSFLCSIMPSRPENLHQALDVLNRRFGIDAHYVQNLAHQEPKLAKAELSEIFNDIWDKDWYQYYKEVAAYLSMPGNEVAQLSRQAKLKEINELFAQHGIESRVEIKDLDSIRDFRTFALQHNLVTKLKKVYNEIETNFIPKLEKAIWLDQARLALQTGTYDGQDKEQLLQEIGVIKASAPDESLAELKQKALSLLKLRKLGNVNEYSTLVELLKASLKQLKLSTEQIDKLNLPQELKTQASIQKVLQRIARTQSQLTEHKESLGATLIKNLELIRWFIAQQTNPPTGDSRQDQAIRKMLENLG